VLLSPALHLYHLRVVEHRTTKETFSLLNIWENFESAAEQLRKLGGAWGE
jgi:hypothetical protein